MGIMVCMRTTLNIDDALLAEAREMTGETEKTKLVHLGLEALIQRTAALRLAALGGTDGKAAAGPRRKASRSAR
ncbi:MAG: type II toxin-antitoxin system VapB family antitoxin [Verrucomicrobiales bacterium]|nr:type II toxin-antitoxin system VapB family antitoxin [Verrucomicrobiales bacterium]